MHVNFGLVPPLEVPTRGKRERYAAYASRATTELQTYLDARPDLALSECRTQLDGILPVPADDTGG